MLLAFACFGTLGGLAAAPGSSTGDVVALALAGFLIGLAVRAILIGLLGSLNPALLRDKGAASISASVDKGLLLLIPFTVMATISRLGLDWDAALVFTSAALMTSAGAAGSEVVRLGGRSLPSMVAPLAVGIASSILWAIGVANAASLVSGAGG